MFNRQTRILWGCLPANTQWPFGQGFVPPFSVPDGVQYKYLLKGHEDLRLDERVMQLFGLTGPLRADFYPDKNTHFWSEMLPRFKVFFSCADTEIYRLQMFCAWEIHKKNKRTQTQNRLCNFLVPIFFLRISGGWFFRTIYPVSFSNEFAWKVFAKQFHGIFNRRTVYMVQSCSPKQCQKWSRRAEGSGRSQCTAPSGPCECEAEPHHHALCCHPTGAFF